MLASMLATFAVISFLVKNVQKYKNQGNQAANVPLEQKLISAFLTGIVTANGLFHLLHGVLLQRDFPAPFAKLFGHGEVANISNIVWGLFNLIVAFMLIRKCKKAVSRWLITSFIILGFLTMSFLLRFVLLSGYFDTHAW